MECFGNAVFSRTVSFRDGKIQGMIDTLKEMAEVIDCFDEEAWYALVDYVTVYSRDNVYVTFRKGEEVKV